MADILLRPQCVKMKNGFDLSCQFVVILHGKRLITFQAVIINHFKVISSNTIGSV